MVLRGSRVAPEESLPSLQKAAEKAKRELDDVQKELEIAERSVVDTLSDANIDRLNKTQLKALVHRLHDHIEFLEKKSFDAQQQVDENQAKIVKTLKQFGAGGAAGAIARTTVAPIDRVKILMQTAHLTGGDAKHRSIFGSLKHIVREEGLRSLWRGNLTNSIRVVPHTAVQFFSYDKYKPLIVAEGEPMTIQKRLLAGALSGMTAATVTHPLDVVRIRLQTEANLKGLGDAIKSVYMENQSFRTFYKGYTPAMLSLSPFIAINFATFDTLKTLYYGDIALSKQELKSKNPGMILLLGAAAGLIAQTCCYPLDTVRRRMQLRGRYYTSTPNAFLTIAKEEGIRGFYKGMSANALKVVPNNAIRFAAYEVLKQYITEPEKPQPQSWRSRFRENVRLAESDHPSK